MQKESSIRISDNSGGIRIKCIHLYLNNRGNIGDKILGSIQKIKTKKRIFNSKIKVENHSIYKALIIKTKRGFLRHDGSRIYFNKSGVLLVTRTNEKVIGTRLLCPLVKELRNKKYLKFLILGSKII